MTCCSACQTCKSCSGPSAMRSQAPHGPPGKPANRSHERPSDPAFQLAPNNEQRKTSLSWSQKQPVLVLAPHPDDETFGCGGTIRMLAESGVAVDVAFMTRGEQGIEGGAAVSADAGRQMGEVRTLEARAACDVLGVRAVVFLPGTDSRLADQPELASSIADLLRKGGYQRVFCPWPHDAHDDHQATFALLRGAVTQNHFTTSFWLYEV